MTHKFCKLLPVGLSSLTLILLVSLKLTLFTPPLLAQTSPSTNQADNNQAQIKLSLTPPTAYLKVRAGQKAIHTIMLENQGSKTLSVQPKLVDFHPNGKNGAPILGKTMSFPYFVLPNFGLPLIKLRPKGKAKIDLVINPDKLAQTQEYPIAVMFYATADKANDQNTQVSATMVSNLIILVVGDEKKINGLLKIKQIQTPLIVDSFRPVKFKVLAQNHSPAAQIATGSAQVINLVTQRPKAYFSIFPTSILGQSSRYLLATYKNPTNANDKINTEPTDQFITKNKFFFGVYTIQVTINHNQTLTKHIIALPISVLILVLIGVIIFVAVYYLYHNQKSWIKFD